VSAVARLSPVELTACWDALGLDLPPARLTRLGPGRGFDECQRRSALAELTRRSLSDGQRPCSELADVLRLVNRPHVRVDLCWGSRGNGVVEAVGALAGVRGVTVVDIDGAYTVTAMDSSRVPGSLLGLLGPAKPGLGRAVNIPTDLLDAAVKSAGDNGLWDMTDRLFARGIPRLDANSLAHMCEGICGRGQLGATGFAAGRALRAPWVVGIHKTDAGGWFTQIRRRGTATIRPADIHELLRQWHILIEHCRKSRSRYADHYVGPSARA
jgi:ESX secretion-associated protein EspG